MISNPVFCVVCVLCLAFGPRPLFAQLLAIAIGSTWCFSKPLVLSATATLGKTARDSLTGVRCLHLGFAGSLRCSQRRAQLPSSSSPWYI
jgi:hypothetical protein